MSFTHYVPEEDFVITSHSDRGDAWLVDNAPLPPADVDDLKVPYGNAWIKTLEEFERLYAKAKNDGLVLGPIEVAKDE